MTVKERAQLEKMLHEYEVTLMKILPRSYRNGDNAIVDEISHLLSVRDWLDKNQLLLIAAGAKLGRPLHVKLAELDEQLFQQRQLILDAYPNYKQERKRLGKHRRSWWWWLDEAQEVRSYAHSN